MTVLIPFLPNNTTSPPFQAIVTLDGQSYALVAMWNLYRGAWYVSINDQSGNVVFFQPLIASPIGVDIPLAPGVFSTSTLVFRADTGNFEQTP